MTDQKTALPLPSSPLSEGKVFTQPVTQSFDGLKRVMLATPVTGGMCEMFYVHSLCESAKALLANGIVLAQVLYSASDGRHMAINQAITDAWSNGFDGLVVASSDVSWEPQALYDLTTSDKDCVALPVATDRGIGVTLGEISRLQQDESSGEIKVISASTDLIYLSSYTLSRLCSTHHSISYMGRDVKVVLNSGDSFGVWAEEGEILRSRLSELNIEMWLNPNYTAGTRRYYPFAGDFAAEIVRAQE